MINYVKFLRGTPAAFEKLATKDSNTLYFISEADASVGSLYLGNKLIAGANTNVDISNASIADLKDVIIDSTGLTDGSILMYDWESKTWTPHSVDEIVVDAMVGASAEKAGSSGLVPAPKAGEQDLYLRGDGTWAAPALSEEDAQKIADLESQVAALLDGIEADEDGNIPSVKDIATEALAEALIPEGAQESLDTLKEIADWIQAHPGDIAELNSTISDIQDAVGALDEVVNGKDEVEGLVGAVSTLQTEQAALDGRVGALENILNDTTNEEGEAVPGLVSIVNSLLDSESEDNPFALKAHVGDINDLVFSDENNTSIVDEINSINQRLTWIDMEE